MHDQKQGTPTESQDAKGGEAARALGGYPVGRGYGHDYMRGGEVFGGYGYSDRPEYERRRGDKAEPS